MEKLDWIKDLVSAEEQMEESGLIDMSLGFDQDRALISETIQFLLQLKTEFVDAATCFNELKTSALGRIKIYGIAKTHADFMLFRNGFKMIFSMKNPGSISIRFNFIGSQLITTGAHSVNNMIKDSNLSSSHDEQTLDASWGPFGEIEWKFQGQNFKVPFLIRHYLRIFLQESAK